MTESSQGVEVQRVEALLGLGRGAQAEAAARALVGADPASAVALLLLARALLIQHTYPAAAEAARAAIALEPDHPAAYHVLAEALADLDPSAALEPARRVVDLAPQDPVALYTLARVLTKGNARQRREAVTVAEQVVSVAPLWADAANLLGLSQRGVGRNDEARSAYLRALELDPQHGHAKNNLAALEIGSGALTLAARRLSAAVVSDPQLAMPRQNIDLIVALLCRRLLFGCLAAGTVLGALAWARAPFGARATLGLVLLLYAVVLGVRTVGVLPPGFWHWGAGIWGRGTRHAKWVMGYTAVFLPCALVAAFGPDEAARVIGILLAGAGAWFLFGAVMYRVRMHLTGTDMP